ncbi:hypothetical protein DEO72_LG11g1628 [Vigna unguiculata]|uniref:Uncharacterized protein n=1 Tax=Vigna unguiculata TaxID=3917 RepID=A0A4D6NQR8_VIGUN|nr:hypothetical protein DEO72_LG11g1628 [Vigna unguiculata]
MAAAPASSPARCSADPSAVPSSSRFTVLQQRSDASSAAAMVRRGARWRRWCGGSAGDGGSFRCCCCAELRWRRERARNRLRGGVVVAGRGAAMVELLLQRWRAKLDGDGGGVVQIPAKCCRCNGAVLAVAFCARRWRCAARWLLLWCGEGAMRGCCCFRRVSVVAGEEMAAAVAMVMEREEKIRVRVLGDEDDDVAAFHWTAC